MEINGVAHIILTVSDWERCRPFHEALLHFMGLQGVFGGNDSIYYVGGRTAVGVGPLGCRACFAAVRSGRHRPTSRLLSLPKQRRRGEGV